MWRVGLRSMIRVSSLWLLVITISVAGAGDTEPRSDMSGDELLERINAESAPFILDVRSATEYNRGHVPGAVNIPFQSVYSRREELPGTGDEPILVYCGHGPRAYLARLALRYAGNNNIIMLKGHMSLWKKKGFPVVTGENH